MKTQSKRNPKPEVERRSFIRKTGVALSAVVASTVAGIAKPRNDNGDKDQIDRLSRQIAHLQDANAIRSLHRTYEHHLEQGAYEEIVGLFADDCEVSFNGGLFAGKERGIRRLYVDNLSRTLTGRKTELAAGMQLDVDQQQETIEIAPDRLSAKARFPYSIKAGAPLEGESSLLDMARLHGEGVARWREGGICEAEYVKEGQAWKIKKLEYRAAWHTMRSADGAPAAKFSKTYPDDPVGPDRLV